MTTHANKPVNEDDRMTATPKNRQLQAFVTLAKELHVTRATLILMTKQPMSNQIAALERALGTPLFERTSREVRLTSAGAAMLPRAREALNRPWAARTRP